MSRVYYIPLFTAGTVPSEIIADLLAVDTPLLNLH
jgi:hypothetical protein